ncbi:MAG: hypothetical protein KBS91_02910 [Firmicutes bacterium]|nr:hypothetical protein [Candidatus Caballimonas caccae]
MEVKKEKCDKTHLYALINLEAMESSAQDLDAGAFKLWMYFAKNQNGYEFALSSKDVEQTFGMKIKQYNNAVEQLITKGYLVNVGGNKYTFNEKPVITKGNNTVITKEDNAVITKSNKALLPLDIRNITDDTTNTTKEYYNGLASSNLRFEESKRPAANSLIDLGVDYEALMNAKSQ